jgi:hypothetical protein
MLQSVFKELYNAGALIFLDTDTYITNNTPMSVDHFTDRDKFARVYSEPVEHGWIYCHCGRDELQDVVRVFKEDACCLVEFGFNADTEKKALELGRLLVKSLLKFHFMAHWDEVALKDHKISTVVTMEDLPACLRNIVENADDDDD